MRAEPPAVGSSWKCRNLRAPPVGLHSGSGRRQRKRQTVPPQNAAQLVEKEADFRFGDLRPPHAAHSAPLELLPRSPPAVATAYLSRSFFGRLWRLRPWPRRQRAFKGGGARTSHHPDQAGRMTVRVASVPDGGGRVDRRRCRRRQQRLVTTAQTTASPMGAVPALPRGRRRPPRSTHPRRPARTKPCRDAPPAAGAGDAATPPDGGRSRRGATRGRAMTAGVPTAAAHSGSARPRPPRPLLPYSRTSHMASPVTTSTLPRKQPAGSSDTGTPLGSGGTLAAPPPRGGGTQADRHPGGCGTLAAPAPPRGSKARTGGERCTG